MSLAVLVVPVIYVAVMKLCVTKSMSLILVVVLTRVRVTRLSHINRITHQLSKQPTYQRCVYGTGHTKHHDPKIYVNGKSGLCAIKFVLKSHLISPDFHFSFCLSFFVVPTSATPKLRRSTHSPAIYTHFSCLLPATVQHRLTVLLTTLRSRAG